MIIFLYLFHILFYPLWAPCSLASSPGFFAKFVYLEASKSNTKVHPVKYTDFPEIPEEGKKSPLNKTKMEEEKAPAKATIITEEGTLPLKPLNNPI